MTEEQPTKPRPPREIAREILSNLDTDADFEDLITNVIEAERKVIKQFSTALRASADVVILLLEKFPEKDGESPFSADEERRLMELSQIAATTMDMDFEGADA